ncbi:hypothetical protein [Shewanella mangrovisoli]|uniref:hypothetical protein n=1 Tax=Shewanella mangrovisoli TaxID=2864211 RepID=UPI0035B9B501
MFSRVNDANSGKINIIVIFNYNYSYFINSIFNSLRCNDVVNNDKYVIFFCDDGSNDDSTSIVNRYINDNDVWNIELVEVRPKNSERREFFSFGQLCALQMVLASTNLENIDLCFLVDCDDYYPSNYFSTFYDFSFGNKKEVYFSKIFNVSVDGTFLNEKYIKRPVSKLMSCWPTVTCTSGVVLSSSFLRKYNRELFDFSLSFTDVWLDSRIAMLSVNHGDVAYLNIFCNRVIHNANDSRKSNFKRKFLKQIQSQRYFKCYVKTKRSIRLKVLDFLDSLFY